MTGPHLIAVFGWALAAIALAGSLYALGAALVALWHLGPTAARRSRTEAVTLLKPLHGAEPRLLENLSSFLALDHAGPVQILFGAHRRDDPALEAVRALRAAHPDKRIDLVIDATQHGANGKIANLINMIGRAAHPVLVISDSDIAVAPDYLTRVLAALDAPGVGAVTCAYRGRGDAGFWSRMAAAGIDWQLLPGILFGVRMRLATPCMGSTIALSAQTLTAIGGFGAFADTLADDYATGEAVRGLGLKVAVPPMLVTHASADAGFAEFWRHEVRWGATILGVAPGRYVANVIAMPLPLALLAIPFAPGAGALATLAALIARTILAAAVGRASGAHPLSLLWLPVRDFLTFAAFLASFFARSVAWRDASLVIRRDGLIASGTETAQ
jgi:ceramide glucosyltransferase